MRIEADLLIPGPDVDALADIKALADPAHVTRVWKAGRPAKTSA